MPLEFPSHVKLREVAPRDGLQSLSQVLPTRTKLDLIRRAVAAGIGEIEVTSSVSPRLLPQLADAVEVLAGLGGVPVVKAVLAPTADRARQAIDAGADQIVAFMSASESHNRANVKRSVAESMAEMGGICRLAAEADVPVVAALAVSFGCPFENSVPRRHVFDLAARMRDHGAASLIFGDTVGMAVPTQVDGFVRAFRDHFGDLPFSLHFHNNRGLAMTNLYAALGAGATTFDTSIGGIGGCPTVPQAAGNLATEDVVLLLDNLGIETGIDLAAVIDAARFLERALGFPLPGQAMKSGPIVASGAASAMACPA